MSDIELDAIRSGYNLSKINSNFEKVEDVINDDVLHRSGGNNTMSQELDMNSNRVINTPKPLYSSEVANKQYVDDALSGVEFSEAAVVQETGTAADKVMSQKSVSEIFLSKVKLDSVDLASFGILFDGSDEGDKLQEAIDYAWDNLTNSSALFNGGPSLGFIEINLQGKQIITSTPIKLVNPSLTGSGGAGGNVVIKGGSLKADPSFVGDYLLKVSSTNNFDWTSLTVAEKLLIDCNRVVKYGVRAEKSVGISLNTCQILGYTERGVFTDNLTFNFAVSKCYIEAFPFGTGGTPAENRENAPEYGVYFGNSDNVIDNDTVIIGNVYGCNVPAKTRVIGNHFYGNVYSMRSYSSFSVITGNYIEDPIVSEGLVDQSITCNFFSESNKGASIIIHDDGSGNGRGSSVVGNTVSNFSWDVSGSITLSSASGDGVVVTSTESDFYVFSTRSHSSVGAVLTEVGGDGRAVVVEDVDTNSVIVDIIEPFSATSFSSGGWDIDRSFIAVLGENKATVTTMTLLGNTGRNTFASGATRNRYEQGNALIDRLQVDRLETPRSDTSISSGQITATSSYMRVDTEGGAATDEITNILGGRDGYRITLRSLSLVRNITVRDGVGNIDINGDFTTTDTSDSLSLIYDSTDNTWREVSRSTPYSSRTDVTISGGVITAQGDYVSVDTEGSALTDSVDTILGGRDGKSIVFRARSTTIQVTFALGGNLRLASDFTTTGTFDTITLVYDASDDLWREVSRSTNIVTEPEV